MPCENDYSRDETRSGHDQKVSQQRCGARFLDARARLLDHAAELGADPRRLLLAADHGGAGLVAALARHARDRGWPPIARHVLVDPELDPARVDELVVLLGGKGRQ